jgi:hypothetical protein
LDGLLSTNKVATSRLVASQRSALPQSDHHQAVQSQLETEDNAISETSGIVTTGHAVVDLTTISLTTTMTMTHTRLRVQVVAHTPVQNKAGDQLTLKKRTKTTTTVVILMMLSSR